MRGWFLGGGGLAKYTVEVLKIWPKNFDSRKISVAIRKF